MAIQNRYDVIIIGAGIGGLVCGNYLAGAGKKVLILEKNSFTGGCCSSFMDNGYFFDAGGHLISAVGRDGFFKDILIDLGIYCRKDYIRLDPLAVFHDRGHTYIFKSDFDDNRKSLKRQFPDERVSDFFSLLERSFIDQYSIYKNKTLQELLDEYFRCPEIKFLFNAFLVPLATIPTRISAMVALNFLSSTFRSGGFYPRGGMQSVANRLAESFNHKGGEILLNSCADIVVIRKRGACSVITTDGKEYDAKVMVGNTSPANILKLIQSRAVAKSVRKFAPQRCLTDSLLVVNVALRDPMAVLAVKTGHFFLSWNNYKRNGESFLVRDSTHGSIGFICTANHIFQKNKKLRDRPSVCLLHSVAYKGKRFWAEHKEKLAESMINSLNSVVPGFKANILFKRIITPWDIERYTSNDKGAVGGWAVTPQQSRRGFRIFPNEIVKQIFFLTGHWTSPGMGVSGVAISGKNTAGHVLKAISG